MLREAVREVLHERQRRSIIQPRVERNELPWVFRKKGNQPQRGCINPYVPHGFNPVGVVVSANGIPRVGAPSSRQPWADGCNAVGVGNPHRRLPIAFPLAAFAGARQRPRMAAPSHAP